MLSVGRRRKWARGPGGQRGFVMGASCRTGRGKAVGTKAWFRVARSVSTFSSAVLSHVRRRRRDKLLDLDCLCRCQRKGGTGGHVLLAQMLASISRNFGARAVFTKRRLTCIPTADEHLTSHYNLQWSQRGVRSTQIASYVGGAQLNGVHSVHRSDQLVTHCVASAWGELGVSLHLDFHASGSISNPLKLQTQNRSKLVYSFGSRISTQRANAKKFNPKVQ